jgi:hypothetical protein
MNLPKGIYNFRAVIGDPGALEYRVIELGVQEVATDTLKFVMNRNEQLIQPNKVAVSKVIEVKPDFVNRSISSVPDSSLECNETKACPTGKTCHIGKGEVAGWCQ